MGKWMGVLCLVLGVCCLLGAAGFVVYNHYEAESAAAFSQTMLEEVQTILEEKKQEKPTQGQPVPDDPIGETPPPAELPVERPKEMATVMVDGNACIGILSVPVLELELPVLTDWSYAKLKKAPCHYFGTCFDQNFVIAAHNYAAHFGRLGTLQPGDLVLFTDVNGTVFAYEVVLLETLPANATEEMITSGFDLSLYTCTPGGANRVTVRCQARTDV